MAKHIVTHEHIGRHRNKMPSKGQTAKEIAFQHILHSVIFTMSGLPPILAFEAFRAEWEQMFHFLSVVFFV